MDEDEVTQSIYEYVRLQHAARVIQKYLVSRHYVFF